MSTPEKGRKQPSPEVAQAMARRLGVSLDSIQYVIETKAAA